MNKIFFKLSRYAGMLCLLLLACTSCDKDDVSMPVIESVWSNMSTIPIHQMECVYPGQTISLRGSGLSGANAVIVNGTEIDLTGMTGTHAYNTDRSIIVRLPVNVATMWDNGETSLKVKVGRNEAVYEPFYVKNTSEKPQLSSGLAGTGFSSIVLVPGSTLTITGKNLSGATEVYLPLAFDGKIKCEFDPAQVNTDESLHVIVPESDKFAQGRAEIVMTKSCYLDGAEYVERLYSGIINFSN